MTDAPRLRRSVLFLPASNDRAMAKARILEPDAVILDLEDAVAPNAKTHARSSAREAIGAKGFGAKTVAVRINELGSPEAAADVEAITPAQPDAIVIPKVEDAEAIEQLCAALDGADAPRGLALWAMIETPRGVLNLPDIVNRGARRRLDALVFGANDYGAATGVVSSADRMEVAGILTQIVAAGRAHGLTVIDSVYNDHGDVEGFSREAAQARRFGFDGKALIHPSQIDPCHAAFAPTPEEIAHARKVVAAFADPSATYAGALSVDGQMVERLHLEAAKRTLAKAGERP